MNHNIKVGDTVKCIDSNPYSEMVRGQEFVVHKVDGNKIYWKDGFSKHYTRVALMNKRKKLHQQWKDLYDKGVQLEWSRTGTWYGYMKGKAATFNETVYSYRVKDLGYDYYKSLLDRIDLSFMTDKDIVVETYGLSSLAQAFVDRGVECGSYRNKNISIVNYNGVHDLDKCFGLYKGTSTHGSRKYFEHEGYTILSFQELLAYPDAQMCQPSDDGLDAIKDVKPVFRQEYLQPKEPTMNPLDLILLSIFMQEDKPKDATNANHIAVLTEADGKYVGYIYADNASDFDDVMRKPENETRKLHIFNYDSTIAQKPRKIVKVDRV